MPDGSKSLPFSMAIWNWLAADAEPESELNPLPIRS
jgi:hypothetical protein